MTIFCLCFIFRKLGYGKFKSLLMLYVHIKEDAVNLKGPVALHLRLNEYLTFRINFQGYATSDVAA